MRAIPNIERLAADELLDLGRDGKREAGGREDHVVALPGAFADRVARVGKILVVAGTAEHCVSAEPPDEVVVAETADERVGAGAPGKLIASVAAIEEIVSGPAAETRKVGYAAHHDQRSAVVAVAAVQ